MVVLNFAYWLLVRPPPPSQLPHASAHASAHTDTAHICTRALARARASDRLPSSDRPDAHALRTQVLRVGVDAIERSKDYFERRLAAAGRAAGRAIADAARSCATACCARLKRARGSVHPAGGDHDEPVIERQVSLPGRAEVG